MTRILDEFRDREVATRLLDHLQRITTQPWRIMEVCGGQTHSIIRHGIDQLLPDSIELIHGPGCPVCVTPLQTVDRAIHIAALPDVTFCTFGDMLRVPDIANLTVGRCDISAHLPKTKNIIINIATRLF